MNASTPHTSLHNEWFCMLCFIVSSNCFFRHSFWKRFWLICQAAFTQRHTNQFLRETNNLNISPYLLLFVLVLSLFITHPSWKKIVGLFFNFKVYFGFLCFWIKYLLIRWIGHLFQQVYF